MSTATERASIGSWITAVPDHVPDEMVRYYAYWKVFYVLAGAAHALALFNFWQTGVQFMAVFNVFSVALFATAFVLLRKGYYRLAYWGAFTELSLHGIAATICIGLQYGFQNYTFLVVILLFIQPFYSIRFTLLLAALTLLVASGLTYYVLNHPPIYTIPEADQVRMTVWPVMSWPVFVLIMVMPFIRASARAEEDLAAAYGESERLLLNILPAPIARRLKGTEGMIADDHERVAILFADIVGFTSMSGRLQPAEMVTLLNGVFAAIDELVSKYGVEKIKTIGDAYMVVAGVPNSLPDPEGTIAGLALDIQETASRFKEPGSDQPVQIRIGINSGKVVAGVIGKRKFAYDLWGDAVNVAARMEANGVAGKIQVTDEFAGLISDRFEFEPRGKLEIKGKGLIGTSFLVGERSAPPVSSSKIEIPQ